MRVGPPPKFEPLPGTEFTIEADLVLLAMGFLGPVRHGMLDQLGVALDSRGNVATDANSMTSVPCVFVAGDMRRGQSLIVWAIAEGRAAAKGVDAFLKAEIERMKSVVEPNRSNTVTITVREIRRLPPRLTALFVGAGERGPELSCDAP